MTHTKQINNEINDWPSIEPELAVQNVGLHSCCGDEFNADHVRYVKYSDNVDACNKPDLGLSTKKNDKVIYRLTSKNSNQFQYLHSCTAGNIDTNDRPAIIIILIEIKNLCRLQPLPP